jgi:hypothetical protein
MTVVVLFFVLLNILIYTEIINIKEFWSMNLRNPKLIPIFATPIYHLKLKLLTLNSY